MVINLSFSQAVEVLQGRDTHGIGAFAAASCACKSKSHLVTHFALRPGALSLLERAGYGIHSVSPQAPSLGVALIGGLTFDGPGYWQIVTPPSSLGDFKAPPFQFQSRLHAFKAPTLSIMARCTCFNTYIVSVMPYTISYFGLTTF